MCWDLPSVADQQASLLEDVRPAEVPLTTQLSKHQTGKAIQDHPFSAELSADFEDQLNWLDKRTAQLIHRITINNTYLFLKAPKFGDFPGGSVKEFQTNQNLSEVIHTVFLTNNSQNGLDFIQCYQVKF